jgi:hypothetical protein
MSKSVKVIIMGDVKIKIEEQKKLKEIKKPLLALDT